MANYIASIFMHNASNTVITTAGSKTNKLRKFASHSSRGLSLHPMATPVSVALLGGGWREGRTAPGNTLQWGWHPN